MIQEDDAISLEERKRRLYERLKKGFAPVPKADVVVVPVSGGFAEKVRANPDGLRLSVRGYDGITSIERPRTNPLHVTVVVDRVREVDALGRPVWDRPGAVHEYNPLDALTRN
jgi:hypothetical protein